MTPEERSVLREAIAQSVAQTREEIDSLEEATRPVAPDVSIGRLTRMDAIVNKGVTETALVTARQRLEALKLALSKVDEADFGECEECLKPIPAARLLAMPETTLCVACAGRLEDD